MRECVEEIKFRRSGERWPKVIVDDRGITIRVMGGGLAENTVMSRGCKM